MIINNICPDCGESLAEKVTQCTCGWQNEVLNLISGSDFRCQYRLGERRCPLIGTMCASPKGNHLWFCRQHWLTKDDPVKSEKALDLAEIEYRVALSKKRDWGSDISENIIYQKKYRV